MLQLDKRSPRRHESLPQLYALVYLSYFGIKMRGILLGFFDLCSETFESFAHCGNSRQGV